MDQPRLDTADRLIAVSATVLLLASLLRWFGGDNGRLIGGGNQSLALPNTTFAVNAWGSTTTLIAELIGIGMLIYVLGKFVGLSGRVPVGPLSAGQILLGLGIAAFALVAIKFLAGTTADLNSFGLPNLPAHGAGSLRLAYHKTRGPGIVVGLIATAGLAFGGLLSLRAERADGGA